MRIIDLDGLAAALGGLTRVPRVVAPGSFATPNTLLHALDAELDEWRLFVVNALPGIPYRKGITYETCFVGPGMRGSASLDYYPCRLSLAPRLFWTTLPPDIVVLHTSRPHGGYVSMGIEVQVMVGALEAARARGALVLAQINPHMPFTHGDGVVSVDDIAFGVEVDEPLPAAPDAPIDDVALEAGRLVASRISDGSTLQMGIGALPDGVMAALEPRRRLGIWTELFTEPMFRLWKSGSLDADRQITASFMYGSQELYSWVDDNPSVVMRRCEVTNDPGRIAAQSRMVSVNTALQVDLYGQANASRIGNRIYSGTGGQTDFIIGAMHAPGGQAFLALKSWHPKARRSTIVGRLDQPATSMQMTSVVTENGIADLMGNHQVEQARQLVEHAAHPDVREALRDEARTLGLGWD